MSLHDVNMSFCIYCETIKLFLGGESEEWIVPFMEHKYLCEMTKILND